MSQNNFNYSEKIAAVSQKIAPSWSLENMVAVNPYMGMSDHSFSSAANAYQKLAGVNLVMPKQFYIDMLSNGKITDKDLKNALHKNGHQATSIREFKEALESAQKKETSDVPYKVKILADITGEMTHKNWTSFVLDRISSWAASYFDQGQAFWKTAASNKNIYESWRLNALADKAPKIMGLKSYKSVLKTSPLNQKEAIEIALKTLGLADSNIDNYLHALLLKFGGWSSFIAGLDWDENLYDGAQDNLEGFIAILLTWEACLFKVFSEVEPALEAKWKINLGQIADVRNMKQFDRELALNLILQDALDFSRERELIKQFEDIDSKPIGKKRPNVQAIFCIDVRSEIYRRQLENTSKDIETLGFAGFFGFPINYKGIGHTVGQNQCPALIPSGPVVQETLPSTAQHKTAATQRFGLFQLDKHWKRFKTGAISGFSFVSPIGLFYAFKLITDSLHITKPSVRPNEQGLSKTLRAQRQVDVRGIPLDDQVAMAKGALTGMGLTTNFAPLVLVTGHVADTVNNPHATGLDCGACGGHSGEANAMTAEAVLNNPKVRDLLENSGIVIPKDTHFVAALHNTTTDQITILSEQFVPESHSKLLKRTKEKLAIASFSSRQERALRFDVNPSANKDRAVMTKSRDWSTVRPEWGLAGCSAFIIAPRQRTANMNLDGKSFLHNYDWQSDQESNVLETIMTAPMVVTSWINLQYFASTVDNKNFGSGNKTLHNVTGGFGVLEGGAGDLRIGLAFQSVHDGEKYQHMPNRLNVIIDAPIEAINNILKKHPNVKALFDNNWVNLLAINPEGKITQRYNKNLNWEHVIEKTTNAEILNKRNLISAEA